MRNESVRGHNVEVFKESQYVSALNLVWRIQELLTMKCDCGLHDYISLYALCKQVTAIFSISC